MSLFFFDLKNGTKAVHRVTVPKGIENKSALLDILSTALDFPKYFGKSWDGLEECLRDLSWLDPGDVLISHEDLPLSKDRHSLSTYLAILKGAIERWDLAGSNLIFALPDDTKVNDEVDLLLKRKLMIAFPKDYQDLVERTLAGPETRL